MGEKAHPSTKSKLAIAIIAVCILSLSLLAVAGCANNKYEKSKYLGTWTATSATMGNVSEPIDKILGSNFSFELKADGKATLTTGQQTESGSWEELADGFTVADQFTMKVDGSKGTMDYQGLIISFEHKK